MRSLLATAAVGALLSLGSADAVPIRSSSRNLGPCANRHEAISAPKQATLSILVATLDMNVLLKRVTHHSANRPSIDSIMRLAPS